MMMRNMLTDTTQDVETNSPIAESDAPAAALEQRFGLGDWLVCPELNRIQRRHGDEHRQLEPRLIHLLCYLAANPDRVLNRDCLVQELWPRVIVNENSLTRAMSELRKHLAVDENPEQAYIETIPKKGYRLLVPVELTAKSIATQPTKPMASTPWSGNWQLPFRHALVAMSMSLVIGAWLGFELISLNNTPPSEATLLSDELIDQPAGFFGGELKLSTADDPALLAKSIKNIETPVISNDESQYAYIQHDTTGSTIFLGRLDAAATPVVAVYNTPEKLFNLTWSPLGHGLMFAQQPKVTNAALFSNDRASAELMMIDLSTLEIHHLLPDTNAAPSEQSKPQNLT